MTTPAWAVEFDHEWGVPDWRDPDQYPQPADLPAGLWRWQFIRRMRNYRAAWTCAAPSQRALAVTLAGDPAKVLDVDDRAFVVSTVAYDAPVDFHGLMRYPLTSYPNPRANIPRIAGGQVRGLAFRDEQGGAHSTFGGGEGVSPPGQWIPPGWVQMRFDLTLPIGPQIARAEESLRRAQYYYGDRYGFLPGVTARASSRDRQAKWPLYLRILDARNEAATFDEIGQTLAIGTKSSEDPKVGAKKCHNAAIKVANKGASYR